MNYDIKHTWGGKSSHCKDPFHARQISTPALQPCPALTTTVQRRWPGKPELELYWRTIWVQCILTYVCISLVSRCVFTGFLNGGGWNASKLSFTRNIREPQCVSYKPLHSSSIQTSAGSWNLFPIFIQRIWSANPGACLCEMIPHRDLWEVQVKI